MNHLIRIEQINDVDVIDSRIIAKGLSINHKSFIETIRTYQTALESLGVLPFETAKPPKDSKGGRPETFCYLNEIQCNFVATLSRNTEAVVQFKLALVKAFHEAKQTIQALVTDDFLTQKKEFYRKKGYSDKWIEKRLESVEVRNELEAEWKKRGIQEAKQYSTLTGIIAKETFGITPTEHKKIKGLKSQNLRDHMTVLELAFTTLGEATALEFTQVDDAQGYGENKASAKKGGKFAGETRKALEAQTNKKVVSELNFLAENRDKYLKK